MYIYIYIHTHTHCKYTSTIWYNMIPYIIIGYSRIILGLSHSKYCNRTIWNIDYLDSK